MRLKLEIYLFDSMGKEVLATGSGYWRNQQGAGYRRQNSSRPGHCNKQHTVV